jgi:hypothetical protein
VEVVEALAVVAVGILPVAVDKEECVGVATLTSDRTTMEVAAVVKAAVLAQPNRCVKSASKLVTPQIGVGTGLRKILFQKKDMPAQP